MSSDHPPLSPTTASTSHNHSHPSRAAVSNEVIPTSDDEDRFFVSQRTIDSNDRYASTLETEPEHGRNGRGKGLEDLDGEEEAEEVVLPVGRPILLPLPIFKESVHEQAAGKQGLAIDPFDVSTRTAAAPSLSPTLSQQSDATLAVPFSQEPEGVTASLGTEDEDLILSQGNGTSLPTGMLVGFNSASSDTAVFSLSQPHSSLSSSPELSAITHAGSIQISPRLTHPASIDADQGRRPSSSPSLPPLVIPRRTSPTLPRPGIEPQSRPTPPPPSSSTSEQGTRRTEQDDESIARAAAAAPPTPPRRQLRTRKAQQLNPYTLEALKYQRTLIRNDWQDAVVSQREWHRQEKRRIAEEEAKARAERARAPEVDTQSQWLINSSGPSSDLDPEDDLPGSSQPSVEPAIRVEIPFVPPKTPLVSRNAQHSSPLSSPSSSSSEALPDLADMLAARRNKTLASTGRSNPSTSATKTYKTTRTMAPLQTESPSTSVRKSLLGHSSDSDSSSSLPQPNQRKHPIRAISPSEEAVVSLAGASSAPRGSRDAIIDNNVQVVESSDDEQQPPPATIKRKKRRSRWSGDGSSSDSTDYERRFRQLKKMMPAGMARKHIRDLRAMRHGKAYHSDGHESSGSPERSDAADATITSVRTPAETPSTSPLDAASTELRPGETRKRLRRHGSLDGNDALLKGLDWDSSSTASSSSDANDRRLYSDNAESVHSESDVESVAWWTAHRHRPNTTFREHDAIDRMLSRTAGRKRSRVSNERNKTYANIQRQTRLDSFASKDIRAGENPRTLRNIDRNGPAHSSSRGDDAKSAVPSHKSRKKKRKLDPRIGSSKSHRLGASVRAPNPPVVKPRVRPRLDLERDDVLFDQSLANDGEEETEGNLDSGFLAMLGGPTTQDHPRPALPDPRLAQPRTRRSLNRTSSFAPAGDVGLPVGHATVSPSLTSVHTANAPNSHAQPSEGIVASPRTPAPAVAPTKGALSHTPFHIQPHRSLPHDATIEVDAAQWDDFEGIRMDFGIHRQRPNIFLNGARLLQDSYLSKLADLPDQLCQGDCPSSSTMINVLRLDDVCLTMEMDHDVILSTLPQFLDILGSELSRALGGRCNDGDSSVEDGRRVENLTNDTRVFLGSWLIQQARKVDVAIIFRSYRTILSRLDMLQHTIIASSSNSRVKDVCLQLCWLRFELCWRALAISDTHPSHALEPEAPTIDELLGFSRTLMSLLLHHGLHRGIKAVRSACSQTEVEIGLTHEEASSATAALESASMWIGLIHLLGSFERSRGVLDGNLFWSQFELAFDRWDRALTKRAPLIRAESLWYCLTGLSALSQFSIEGKTEETISLRHCWSLVVKASSFLRLRLDEQMEARMPWHCIKERDAYVRILLQRCCLLVTEWRWSLEGADAALARLFDIFNTHMLNDLPTESVHDFPTFLRNFDVQSLSVADFKDPETDRDPCFHLFVKLLARTGSELRATAKDERDGDRRISRLFSRMTPVRVMPFTRENVPTSSQRSMLFNHYTVVMLFLLLVPSTSSQRLRQIQSFLPSFKDADFWSQITCIRAMMYVAVIFRHHRLDVGPVTKWFGETMTTLLREYEELEKSTNQFDREQQRRQFQTGSGTGDATRLAPLFENAPARQAALRRQQEVVKLLATALRSIQHVIRNADLNSQNTDEEITASVRLPELHLLHLSWTKHLLEAQLAIDPIIGQEALKCIQTFLLARMKALDPPKKPKAIAASSRAAGTGTNEESQDSFADLFEADDNFDFEDPMLAQLLDGNAPQAKDSAHDTSIPAASEAVQRNKAWDREFSDYVKEVISPSLFQLLSNIYHPDRRLQQSSVNGAVITLGVTERITDQRFGTSSLTAGAAQQRMARLIKLAEGRKLLELLVDCWAGCGQVLVANGLREWSSYLGFGNESWKRIDDPVGRRDVGLRFLQNVLSLDPQAVKKREYESDFVGVWIQTAVARVLSVQDVYTISLIERGTELNDGSILSDLAKRWTSILAEVRMSNTTEDLEMRLLHTDKVALDLDTFGSLRQRLLRSAYDCFISAISASPLASHGTIYSSLSALLSSLRVYVDDTPSPPSSLPSKQFANDNDYIRFCHQTLLDLYERISTTGLFRTLKTEYENTLALITKRLPSPIAISEEARQPISH